MPFLFGIAGPTLGETWGKEGTLRINSSATEVGIGVGKAQFVGLTQSYAFGLPSVPIRW